MSVLSDGPMKFREHCVCVFNAFKFFFRSFKDDVLLQQEACLHGAASLKHHAPDHGVQRRMISVDNFFVFLR